VTTKVAVAKRITFFILNLSEMIPIGIAAIMPITPNIESTIPVKNKSWVTELTKIENMGDIMLSPKVSRNVTKNMGNSALENIFFPIRLKKWNCINSPYKNKKKGD
jgi:hypothetical protein